MVTTMPRIIFQPSSSWGLLKSDAFMLLHWFKLKRACNQHVAASMSYVSCLWNTSSVLLTLFTWSLKSSPLHSRNRESGRICFSILVKNKLNWSRDEQTHSSQPGYMWAASMREHMPKVFKCNWALFFTPISFSLQSGQSGPSAMPCWHNEYGIAINTHTQMERVALHMFMTYVGVWLLTPPWGGNRRTSRLVIVVKNAKASSLDFKVRTLTKFKTSGQI